MNDSRFPTLWQAFDKVGDILQANKAQSLEHSNFLHTGGISYGQTEKFHFKLERFNGRFTSKSLHVQIYRDDHGYYELNSYFN